MTDIRIRLIVVILLSLSAFTGVLGTLLAAACWIVFCAEETFSHNSWKLFMPSAVLAAGFPGLILYLSGGDGGIYAAKIFVIFCLAFWLGVSHKPGEFLDLGVLEEKQGSTSVSPPNLPCSTSPASQTIFPI